ncbi:MAG TPA: selenocysteine-specific translation elongation factor [Pyrinomonadaceae bacterium]|nr:selenocysteine-specific translation elongation factor [Pyrinomonadaceae bacterium]
MDLIIGTAGHIDHGKTALVRALTGTDADRLPEEKQRGITIDLGFAEMSIGDTRFGFVDVPGHERFVRNMLAGAHGIDHILLVVAATEGVMPQTREHFDICRLLNIKSGTIVLTKCDLADAETIELAKLDVAELVEGTFLADAEIVETSSISGLGIDELKQHLAAVAAETTRRNNDLVARLPIDRSFTVKGFGTVVTGTLVSGEMAVGDEVELLPTEKLVRVRGLQSHGRSADKALAGQRTAINLAGISHDDITRGMTLVAANVFRSTRSFDAEVEMLADAARPLKSRQRVRIHIGTAEVMARVTVLNEVGEIAAGERGFVQLRPEHDTLAICGDRFIVRSYSPQQTIGGGVVLEPFAARHRRKGVVNTTEFLSKIAAANGDHLSLSRLFVADDGNRGTTIEMLAARLGCPASSVRSLVENNEVAMIDGRVYLVEFAPNSETAKPKTVVEFTADELELLDRLATVLRIAGREVPRIDEALSTVRTSIARSSVDTLLTRFAESGEIVKVSDEFYFAQNVIDDIVGLVRKHADSSTDRVIDVAIFKQLTGMSRKYAIPVLEYLDRSNVTRRYGEKRIIL